MEADMGKRKVRRGRAKAKRATPKRTVAKRSKGKRRATPARPRKSRPRKRTPSTRRSREGGEDRGSTVGLVRNLIEHHETGPGATAGDLDADWQRAESSGEEAVGGSVSTPDQDVVDEIGHALGVEQPPRAPLRTTEEILEDRDRRYWDLERRASRKASKRQEP
jgi:uncharacterized protein DUF6335